MHPESQRRRRVLQSPAVTQRSPTIVKVNGRIERVAPGPPAEAALAAAIQRLQAHDRLAPVWVVVRTPIVGLSLRRRLADVGAFAAVRFGMLGDLAEQLAGIAPSLAGRRRPLSAVALRAAARVALSESPGLLDHVAGHPATEASLASTYRDLRRVDDSDLDRLARASSRAHDVVLLVRRMRALLEPTFYDTLDVLRAAVGRLESDRLPGRDLAEVGDVVLYLPDLLPPDQIALLAALSRHVSVSAVVGRCGDELADRAGDRFAEVLAGCLGVEIAEAVPLAAGSSLGAGAPDVLGAVLTAPDDDVEVREAVRQLIAHGEAGGDLGRCVVSFPDGERSAGLGARVRQQLAAAGIASSGAVSQRLGDTPHAQLLTGLVQLSVPVPTGQELDRGAVMAWLGRGPIDVGRELTRELRTVEALGGIPVGEWDRCSRDAGVLSGEAAWQHRLRAYVQQLSERSSGAQRRATAEDLATFVERLQALTSGASSARSWTALHIWAERALGAMLAPCPERDVLADALADLELLDAVEPLGQLQPSERLRRLVVVLDVALDRPSGDRGRYGVGPTIGPLSTVAGIGSDLLLVLGCREGELPARQPDDPLVPRVEREQIGSLATTERPDERVRCHLVSLLVATERARASFARIDVRAGRAVHPSRWVGELFGGHVTDVPSFGGSLRRVATGAVPAADGPEFELASLVGPDAGGAHGWLDMVDPDYARCRASVAGRREGDLSPFAGYVPAVGDHPDAWVATMSATPLEMFAQCPFQFFAERRLHVRALDAPERLVQIEARERGTLMHAVLEGFFRPGHEPFVVAPLDAQQLSRLHILANEQFERFEMSGKTGKAVFWDTERRRILRDLERYVKRDLDSLAAAGLVPVAVELTFGRDSSPLVVSAAGRDVQFSGSIDRVDRGPDGRLVVVDYKSGRSSGYSEIATEPLGKGRHLQLPIYAKAAREAFGAGAESAPVRAEYRFLQATAAYAVVPVELTDELDDQLSEVLGTLVSTIDAGCFPPRPGNPVFSTQFDHCRYCDFDALCTIDRADLWERANRDPRLQGYSELVGGSPAPPVPAVPPVPHRSAAPGAGDASAEGVA